MRNGIKWALSLALTLSMTAGWADTDAQPEMRTVSKVVKTAIPFQVKYEFSRTVGRGRVVKVQDGKPGELRKVYEIKIIGNGKTKRELVRTEKTDPTPALYHMGKAGFETSRGAFTRAKVMTMRSTAYTPSAGRGKAATGRTATGRRAAFGVIAVDPRIIPLNTLVFVEGYGFAIAADTGGAIKGNIVDVCLPTEQECRNWGRRNVRVHILRPN